MRLWPPLVNQLTNHEPMTLTRAAAGLYQVLGPQPQLSTTKSKERLLLSSLELKADDTKGHGFLAFMGPSSTTAFLDDNSSNSVFYGKHLYPYTLTLTVHNVSQDKDKKVFFLRCCNIAFDLRKKTCMYFKPFLSYSISIVHILLFSYLLLTMQPQILSAFSYEPSILQLLLEYNVVRLLNCIPA